jgi:PHD/YefM family antitoxin component YafN of YafNO toxin-antitoxin module
LNQSFNLLYQKVVETTFNQVGDTPSCHWFVIVDKRKSRMMDSALTSTTHCGSSKDQHESNQTESVSGFRDHYDAVLKQLNDGPVLLLQRSRLAAVLVSHEEWNRIAAKLKRLEQLELLAKAKETKARVARGEETTVTHDELKQLTLAKQAAHVGD